MVTYFNKKDLVSFGKYLLSPERKALIESRDIQPSPEERAKEIHQSDIDNWMHSERHKN